MANGFILRCSPSCVPSEEQTRKAGRKAVLCNEKSLSLKSDQDLNQEEGESWGQLESCCGKLAVMRAWTSIVTRTLEKKEVLSAITWHFNLKVNGIPKARNISRLLEMLCLQDGRFSDENSSCSLKISRTTQKIKGSWESTESLVFSESGTIYHYMVDNWSRAII